MPETKRCTACGAALIGPFRPAIHLTLSAGAEEYRATARARICSQCGLVHWYAEGSSGSTERDSEQAPQPDASYQRRAQMLRMLRRVKRM